MKKVITVPTSQSYKAWYNDPCYIDKTNIILEMKSSLKEGSALFFARPRRRGKSLFLSTIRHFFDETLFKEEYFQDKALWRDEELRKRAGKYFVMSLDLKPLYNRDSKKIEFDALWISILEQIPYDFLQNYLKNYFGVKENLWYHEILEVFTNSNVSIWSFLKSFIENYSKQKDIFLLIDEYDKPINDCLKESKNEIFCKEILANFKDKFYRYLKDIPCVTILTGINKLSMASFFSDFNNLKDYSYLINVGFDEQEVKDVFQRLGVEYQEDLKKWYNGYHFSEWLEEYNPWAITTFLEKRLFESYWSKTWTSPEYFVYLMKDILKVQTLEEFMNLLQEVEYQDLVLNLEFINEQNKQVIMHYFYYAGLLTFTVENRFAIPNNDVLFSYKNLLFGERETTYYVKLRTKSTDWFLNLKTDTSYFKDFITYLIHEKYVNQDKKTLGEIGEQVLASNIALLMKTFIRTDIRREVNILSGRTDIEYIDQHHERVLLELKVIRKSSEQTAKVKEWQEQIEKYKNSWRYDRLYLVLIDLESGEVEIR